MCLGLTHRVTKSASNTQVKATVNTMGCLPMSGVSARQQLGFNITMGHGRMTMEHYEAIENVVHKVQKVNRKFDFDNIQTDKSQTSFLTADHESPANRSQKFGSENKHRLENKNLQHSAKLPVRLTGKVGQDKIDGQPPSGNQASLHHTGQQGDEQVGVLASVRAYTPRHNSSHQCHVPDRLQRLTATTQPGSSKSTLHTWAEPASGISVPACMNSNLEQQVEVCTIVQIMKPSLSHNLILCEVQQAQSVRK